MSVTSIYNDYTKLSSYLKGQQFGPKDDIPPPNMAFPIIPQYHVNYGIDTLSHGYNGVGYYTIETGYGKKNQETTFNVSSCPTNRPLQPFKPVSMSPSPMTPPMMPPSRPPPMPSRQPSIPPYPRPVTPSVENFQHNNMSLKNLDVHLFVQDGCKFCVTAKQFIKQNNLDHQIMIHDLKDPKNLALFKSLNGRGIPFFVSMKTHKTFSGVPKSLHDLLQKLSSSPSPSSSSPSSNNLFDMIKNLNLEMFFSTNCGYCKKLRSLLQQSNLLNLVKIHYENDTETHNAAKKYKIQGFPFIISHKTGKHITGAPPTIQQLIASLS
jgi:glutaredoxin